MRSLQHAQKKGTMPKAEQTKGRVKQVVGSQVQLSCIKAWNGLTRRQASASTKGSEDQWHSLKLTPTKSHSYEAVRRRSSQEPRQSLSGIKLLWVRTPDSKTTCQEAFGGLNSSARGSSKSGEAKGGPDGRGTETVGACACMCENGQMGVTPAFFPQSLTL